MSARAWSRARPAVLVLTLALALGGIGGGAPTVPEAPVGAEVGAGWFGKAVCLACAAAFVAAGGMTIGGTVVAMSMYPELAIGCADTCIVAF